MNTYMVGSHTVGLKLLTLCPLKYITPTIISIFEAEDTIEVLSKQSKGLSPCQAVFSAEQGSMSSHE